MSKEKLYMAYGSNINLRQMEFRCPTAQVEGTYELKGYELVFRGMRKNAVATIEPCEKENVPVLLWRIKPDDEKALDVYEGYPKLYTKENMQISVNKENLEAMVYIMADGYILGEPSEYYKKVIEEGYDNVGFDKNILHRAIEKNTQKMKEEMREEHRIQENIFNMDLK